MHRHCIAGRTGRGRRPVLARRRRAPPRRVGRRQLPRDARANTRATAASVREWRYRCPAPARPGDRWQPQPDAGRQPQCARLRKAPCRQGFAIVSGLAQGIDAAAHEGALDAGGKTVAFLGTGIDRVYPAATVISRTLSRANGALVSEYPLGAHPSAGTFPERNRLISGLSLGTLVVEAARRSGSLITARLAAEQGREVFALPGSIHNPLARGCHELIRQGAKLVETAGDILAELSPLTGHMLETAEESTTTKLTRPPMTTTRNCAVAEPRPREHRRSRETIRIDDRPAFLHASDPGAPWRSGVLVRRTLCPSGLGRTAKSRMCKEPLQA